ncbi:FAD binding domain-containing protein [Xylariales sp. PMI_506]|nr:FAD binding domain-containing protein [Xylariales sp. PMI_506]
MARNELMVAATGLLGVLSVTASAQSSTGLKDCDDLIRAGLGAQVYFSNASTYNASLSSYFSADVQQVHPLCILQPESAEQVALAVSTLNHQSSGDGGDVAVRGGGHSFWPSNNVQGGVTIDLSLMNSIAYSGCTFDGSTSSVCTNGTVSVGSGAKWGDVFAAVEEYGMSVAGGRVGDVGVSGLLLGGGFSFHSGRYGFACDNVVNYEIVLSNGSIINANPSVNSDLFKGLKGGSNNLGLVTRYDIATFTTSGFYAGILAYTYDGKDAILEQFVRMVDLNYENQADSEFVSFSWTVGSDPSIAVITTNSDGISNSTSFSPLNDLPALLDTRGETTYSQFIDELNGNSGLRNVWFTLSFANTLNMTAKATEIFENLVAELETEITGSVELIFLFQPLPTLFASKNPGGNVLGMDTSLQSNAILWQGEVFLDTDEYEQLLADKLAAATAELEAYAIATGQDTPFLYLNYAYPTQNPIASYGAKNVALLKEISGKYDASQFFQNRVTGGFKLTSVN